MGEGRTGAASTRGWVSLLVVPAGAVLLTAYLGVKAFSGHRKRVRAWTAAAIGRIEARVQHDEGRRGIHSIIIPGELHAAAKTLVHASSVAIITGFPCLLEHEPPTETDGPPGAYAIARACIGLGCSKVYLLTDEVNETVVLAGAANSGLPGSRLHLESFPARGQWGPEEEARLRQIAQQVDVVVAIERPGPAPDGSYYTMRALKMDGLVAPLDRLLSMSRARTIGIADGGNEVGCGKVRDSLLSSPIPNAATIHCETPADHLIVASVSNWGGYALAAAAALVAAQEGVFGSRAEAVSCMMVSEAQEAALIHRIVDAGARDGITQQKAAMVDGMPLEASLTVLREITGIATRWSWMW